MCVCTYLHSNVLKQYLVCEYPFIDLYIKQGSDDKCSKHHNRLVDPFRSGAEGQEKGPLINK